MIWRKKDDKSTKNRTAGKYLLCDFFANTDLMKNYRHLDGTIILNLLLSDPLLPLKKTRRLISRTASRNNLLFE